ncbi:MAG: UvrD-helicase domain-containing protein [Phycisphaeraceae bacterium]
MTPSARDTLPHLVVRASAGAGKTYQLTTRYLQLLGLGEPMRNVLATTFTRKAAGEVLARVLGRLAQACVEDAARHRLAEALGRRTLSSRDCGEMLRTLTGSLNRLAVGTIDGFFNRAARAMALELDLPADPRMVDEGSPLARQMRADAIHAVLGEQAAADEGMATLIEMLRRLHHDTAQSSVTDAIDRIVVQLDEVYQLNPDRRLWDALPAAGLLDPDLLTTALHELEAMREALPTTKAGSPNKRFAEAFESLVSLARQSRWDAVLSNGLVKKVATGGASYQSAAIDADWHRAITPIFVHAKAERVRALSRQTLATYDLLALFDRHYWSMRRRLGVLLFSDLTRVLAEGMVGVDVNALCFRLDARVTHLLLDEFQDTSLQQWTVLRPFAEQITDNFEDSRSLFCVGDTKQAIYGWRGGCAELFESVEALPGVETATLSKSWRSSQVVLDTVNRVFGSLSTNAALDDCRGVADAWQRGYPPHVAAKQGLPGHVVLRTTRHGQGEPDDAEDQEDDDDAAAPPDAHAHDAAAYIQQLTQAMPGRTVGVLVRRRKAALALLHALRSIGVHAAEEGGNPIDNAPAVGAVLSAIQLADHPGDSVARFHVVNSPLAEALGLAAGAPIADTDALARRLRRRLIDRGYAAVIGEWVKRLAPSCDAASLRRLMQLIELAERFDEHDAGLRPGYFVDAARAAKVEDASPALVRVMTVHAAKGLEFDAVVLADLDGVLSSSDHRGLVVLDRDSPIAPVRAVYRRADKATMALLPQLAGALAQQTREQRTEDLCLLYVALTRARHALHLLVRPLSSSRKNGQPTGQPTKKGRLNLSYAAILRQALAPDAEEGFDGGELLYESGDACWAGASQPSREGVPIDSVFTRPRREVRLAEPGPGRGRSWRQTTPSAMRHAGLVTADDLLRRSPDAGRAYGTLIHALFERVGFVDEAMPDDSAFERVLSQHRHASVDPVRVLESFKRALTDPTICELLSRRGADTLWRERRFACRLDSALVNGAFDRVHLWHEAGAPKRALIIDYKTDAVDERTLDDVVGRYAEQFGLYRRALCAMLGLEPGAVAVKVCFVGSRRVAAVD